MAKAVASAKQTGGGGFFFADKVAAWLAAHVLSNEPPFGPKTGWLERIDFEARPEGWLLDDLVLTLVESGAEHRCALSVKSNAQFSKTGAPADFVETAWELFLGLVKPVFDASRDYLGIVTAPLEQDVRESLDFVVRTAIHSDPRLLPERYNERRWASDAKRAMFHSFSCPASIRESYGTGDVDIGRLLRRLRNLHLDFESPVSEAEKQTVERCRRALTSGDPDEALALWDNLQRISARLRADAGSITRDAILEELRGTFNLVDLPNHRADWDRLAKLTALRSRSVSDSIGGKVTLDRSMKIVELETAVQKGPGLALLGPSGAGKSSAVRSYVDALLDRGQACLWFDSSSFSRPDYAALEADLQLQHPLVDLFAAVMDECPILVLDGLDRLYDETAISIAAALIRAAKGPDSDSRWRIIVTSQTHDWPRLRRELLKAGAPLAEWQTVELDPVALADLTPVWDAFPQAKRLQYNAALRPLLVNLRILDLIATHLSTEDQIEASHWVGETSVASWYWDSHVRTGADRLKRERFAMLLAERQAEDLRPEIARSRFKESDLAPLEALEESRICRTLDDGRITFSHELTGDWARLRVLLGERDVAASAIRKRVESPAWHRAIRLLGIHLLEHSDDVAQWRALLLELDGNEAAQDLILESPIFAANPLVLLEKAKEDLVANDGALLRRLLGRFLAFGTLPDPSIVAIAEHNGFDVAAAEAEYRVPYWPYWPALLGFLHANRDQFIDLAPVKLSRIAELWLRHTPGSTPFRSQAADIGLGVGERTYERSRTSRTGRTHDYPKQCYSAALLAAAEYPDRVSKFVLRACERVDVEKNEDDRGKPDERSAQLVPDSIDSHRLFDADAPRPDPWPDGPQRPIDGDVCDAILDSASILPLVRSRPDVAREAILACVIEAPARSERVDWLSWYSDLGLVNHHQWHPALYTHGPFLVFLKADFRGGLELILRLVHFATQRWRETKQHKLAPYIGQQDLEAASGSPKTIVDDEHQSPLTVEMSLPDSTRQLEGDAHVYGWASGHGNPPSSVEASLMALEQYLYLEIEAGRPIDEKVDAVLDEARSVAFLGVLADVGKKHSALLADPLMPLLSVAEVYDWDRRMAVYGRSHLMIGQFEGQYLVQLARDFHGQAHRRQFLQELARRLYLTTESVQAYLDVVRMRWEARLQSLPDGQLHDSIAQLIEVFDLSNYRTVSDPVHGELIVNVKAYERHEELAEERKEAEDNLFLMSVPMKCRKLLDESKGLPDDEIEDFISRVQELASAEEGRQDSDHTPLANEVAGVAAVFLRLHSDWLSAYPEHERWCREQLKAVITSPPPAQEFDVPESTSNWTWDCFVADALPLLWAKEVGNIDLRTLVAKWAFAYHHEAVRILFARCSEQRQRLADDFERLRRVVFERAHLENWISCIRQMRSYSDSISDQQLEKLTAACDDWCRETAEAFIDGSLELPTREWSAMDQPERFPDLAITKPRWFRSYTLNLALLRSAHDWMPQIDHAHDATERQQWLDFYAQALAFSLKQIDERHSYPNGDQRWVLRRVASALPLLTPSEDRTEFWKPLVQLSDDAHSWVEYFLHEFHIAGLQSNPSVGNFETVRNEIVDFVLALAQDEAPRRHQDAWCYLIGIDGSTRWAWESRHAPIAERSSALLKKWIARCNGYSRHVAAFAEWLALEAASPVRFVGIRWLSDALLQGERSLRHEDEARLSLARLLRKTWEVDQSRLRKDRETFSDFMSLLRWLTDAQQPLALQLLAEIGGLT